MNEPNWGNFEQRRTSAAPETPDQDFDEICALALSGLAGAQLIAALRLRYIDRTENPNAVESVLRVRVTQQQFVRDLESARDRGLAEIKRKAEAAKKAT